MKNKQETFVSADGLLKRTLELFEKNYWNRQHGHLTYMRLEKLVKEQQEEDKRLKREKRGEKATKSEQRLVGTYTREEQIEELAGGSKGAEVALRDLEVMIRVSIDLYTRALDDAGVYGKELHTLWDQCCGRDAKRMADLIALYMERVISGKELHKIIKNKETVDPDWIREQRIRKQEERYEERNDKG